MVPLWHSSPFVSHFVSLVHDPILGYSNSKWDYSLVGPTFKNKWLTNTPELSIQLVLLINRQSIDDDKILTLFLLATGSISSALGTAKCERPWCLGLMGQALQELRRTLGPGHEGARSNLTDQSQVLELQLHPGKVLFPFPSKHPSAFWIKTPRQRAFTGHWEPWERWQWPCTHLTPELWARLSWSDHTCCNA